MLPDGHQWVALTPAAGSSSLTLLRRTSTTQGWTSSSVPLGPLGISADAAATPSMSFFDANNGWLLVGEQITHTGFGELLHTTDAGATWTLQAGRSTVPDHGAIRFLTAQVGYLDAASTGSWWQTRDAGHGWARLQLQLPSAKKSDAVNILSAPTLAGDAIVVAASFTTPTVGDDDGVGIYRSTDGGATWTVQQLPSQAPDEQYDFATTADGSTYVLLREHPAQDFQSFTWVASRSTGRGQTFTNATSAHNFYPEPPLSLADPNNMWTRSGANGCKTFKTDCWNTTGLVASNDGGSTWHQVKLPSY